MRRGADAARWGRGGLRSECRTAPPRARPRRAKTAKACEEAVCLGWAFTLARPLMPKCCLPWVETDGLRAVGRLGMWPVTTTTTTQMAEFPRTGPAAVAGHDGRTDGHSTVSS